MTSAQQFVVVWIECVAAGGLLLLATWCVLFRLRQPADRINLIQFGVLMALLVPILIGLAPTPAWHLGLVSVDQVPVPAASDQPVHAVQTPLPAVPAGDDEFFGAELTAMQPPSSEAVTARSPAPPTVRPSPAGISGWWLALIVIVSAHGLAILYFGVEWLIGQHLLQRLKYAATPCSEAVWSSWLQVTSGRGIGVRVLVSDRVDSPLAFGWRRATVIIPRVIADGDPQSLRFCLAHEWSHIERGDLWTWRLTSLCRYALWHQPLYWVLRRELRVCQDLLADFRATDAGRDAVEYSDLLVGFARSRQGRAVGGAIAFLDRTSDLQRRVKMILAPELLLRFRSRKAFCAVVALLATSTTLLVSGIRIETAQANDEATRQAAAAQPANDQSAERRQPAETKPAESKEQPAAAKDAGETLHYSGTILDKETGQGIPGATVVVRRSKLTSEENTVIEESRHTTDAEGKYNFEIPPEQVAIPWLYIELDVEHPDYAAQKRFGYALSMIRKNEGLGERPFFEKVELRPSEPATGTVLSPTGEPVVGVRIQGYSKSSATDFRDYGSFTEAVTDESGRFRLNLVKGGVGVVWVLPDEYAGTSRAINNEGRDLGEIQLRPGVRVSGRVLAVDGTPVAGVPIEIEYQGGGNETVNNLPVATSIQRNEMTDSDGRFTFKPLPTGDYRLMPEESRYDRVTHTRERYELPGVFLPTKVTIQEGVAAAPVDVQAVPHVFINAQIYNSKGEKTRGHEFHVFGRMDGQYWFGQGRPNAEGTISLRVPHGLQDVQINLMTNEHGALRFRRGKDQPLENDQRRIELGTLNDDVNGFEIIRYKAPLVLVSAVDENQQPIRDFHVAAAYPWGKQEYILEGEQRSDLSFEHQQDGRYRTSQMLPDEDVKFTVTAKGYESASETVRLPEGESKELVLTLKKSDTAPAE